MKYQQNIESKSINNLEKVYKRYTKAYIGWAVLLFFSSFGLAALNLYLGSIVLLVSIGLFAHQSAIRIKDGELQILSQFIVLKIWRKYPLDTINKITLSSVAQMGGGIASRSGGSWTRTYLLFQFLFYSLQQDAKILYSEL